MMERVKIRFDGNPLLVRIPMQFQRPDAGSGLSPLTGTESADLEPQVRRNTD